MVGRRTSPRCDNCRRRKIKCDLLKPGCSPCRKAGWKCPGFDSSLLFHQHVVEPAKPGSDGTGSPHRHRSDSPNPSSLVRRMPVSPTDKLRTEFVHKGKAGQLTARFIVLPSVRIMEHLPRRLGEDKALDAAVQLICSSDPSESMRKYGLALRTLQDSIDRGPNSEALGAATLLQMHSVYQVTSLNTWAVDAKGAINLHAQGVINMLKARGAHSIKTGFDSCILQAQVGNITFDALRKREPCFLALPDWNAKIRTLNPTGEASDGKHSWEMSLIPIGVHYPGLICRFEALGQRRRKLYSSGSSSECPDVVLHKDLRSIRDELKASLDLVPDDAIKTAPEASVAERIKPALLLASNVYLLMLDYMIEETRIEHTGRLVKDEMGGPTINPAHLTHVLTLDTTKRLYARLQDIDPVALQSTADMLRFTLDRMLDATEGVGSKTGPMAMVIEEVYEMLAPPAGRQRKVPWSEDDAPRPTLGDFVCDANSLAKQISVDLV